MESLPESSKLTPRSFALGLPRARNVSVPSSWGPKWEQLDSLIVEHTCSIQGSHSSVFCHFSILDLMTPSRKGLRHPSPTWELVILSLCKAASLPQQPGPDHCLPVSPVPGELQVGQLKALSSSGSHGTHTHPWGLVASFSCFLHRCPSSDHCLACTQL